MKNNYRILFLFSTIFMLMPLAMATSFLVQSQGDFEAGTFDGSSADRKNNSGNLGIGYRNGSTGDTLTGFWRLDSNVSGTDGEVKDYSGNSENGTTKGSVSTDGEGTFNTSTFRFDGTDDYVDLPQSSVTDWYNGNSLSVSAWFRSNGSGVIFGNEGGSTPGSNNGWVPAVYLDSSGRVRTSIFWHGGTSTTNSSTGYADGEWHHIFATYQGGNETLYVDGSQVDQRTGLSQEDYNSGTYSYFIGSGKWDSWPGAAGTVGWFPGDIDELRVYNESLESSAAQNLYLNGKPFEGKYTSEKLNVSGEAYWNNLEVNATVPPYTNLTAEFKSIDSGGNTMETQRFEVSSEVKNYSLDFSPTDSANVSFNGTSQNASRTWEVSDFSVFYSNKPVVENLTTDTPKEEGMQVNITVDVSDADDNLDTVKLNLTDPAENKELQDAEMQEGSNNTYYRSYQIQDDGNNAGNWTANVSANDTSGAISKESGEFQILEGESPEWRNQAQREDTLDPKESNKLWAEGYDSFNLSYAILATNETGTFMNKTGNYSSPQKVFESDTYVNTTFAWDNNSVSNKTVEWKIWYNDTAGNYNSTDTQSFSVRAEDIEPPIVNIQDPKNTSISDSDPLLNASANEEISDWLYNLDGNGNISFDGSTTIGPLSDGGHFVRVWANDTGGNLNSENVSFSVDTVKPGWSNFNINVSGEINQGKAVNASSNVSDADSGIFRAYLATNETGQFENKTEYGSPETFSNTTANRLADFEWANNSFSGNLGFKIWFRDAAGNWNDTEVKAVDVEEILDVKIRDLESVADWTGEFNLTTVTRQDNSGNLGIGYRNGTEEDGLTGFWRMDRSVSGSGGTVKDYSGGDNSGTTEGGVGTADNGILSTSSFSFDGSNDYYEMPESSVPEWWNGENVAVSAWFKTSGSGVILGSEGGDGPGGDDGWVPALYVGDDGKVRTSLFWHGTTTTTESSSSYDDGNWHHVVATYESGTETLYIDGTQAGQSTGLSQANFSDGPPYNYYVGAGQWDSSWSSTSDKVGWFPGNIDELRIYSEAKGSEEVKDLYFQEPTYEGSYNQSVDVPESGVLSTLRIEHLDIFSGREAWASVQTTLGEKETVNITGSSPSTFDLNFSNKGGKAFVYLNLSAPDIDKTPIIKDLDLKSETVASDVTKKLQNSSGSVYAGATLKYLDSFGSVVKSINTDSEDLLKGSLARDVNYSILEKADVYNSFLQAEIQNYETSRDQRIDSQIVRNYSGSLPSEANELKSVYAFNETDVNYSGAQLSFPNLGIQPNVVAHCTDWNFTSASCTSWEVNSTSDYGAEENSTHITFEVDGFDAFGVGTGDTLPNVTGLKIFDVTGLNSSEKEKKGELEASGLNTTLNISSPSEKQYRFQFKIRNDGVGDWFLNGSDELSEEGLNSSWSVPKIWYNISQDYDGGEFSGGRVEWNTSNGGVLDSGENMYAKFLVNITPTDSEYDLKFKVNDTSENSGSTDRHKLNLTKLGTLNVTLETPPPGTTTAVCRYNELEVNATVDCQGGKCGEVNGSVRYNQSSSADTLIPEGSGQPFYTKEENTKIAAELKEGEETDINWTLNATAEAGENYLVDANFSSELEEIPENNTQDAEISIEQPISVTFRESNIDFGLLDPGVEDRPADNNNQGGYNITVENCGADADLYTKSTNLTTTNWGADEYRIRSENVSYATENDVSKEEQMSGDYQLLQSSISSKTNVTSFYWIDIPEGLKSSEYNGTISYKVNLTG